MTNSRKLAIGFLSFITLAMTLAATNASAAGIQVQSLTFEHSELVVRVLDQKPVSNLCHYFLKRMEYLPTLKALNLQFDSQSPCLVDLYGKRQGIFKWKAPASAIGGGRLKLLINDVESGEIRFENGEASFLPKGFRSKL